MKTPWSGQEDGSLFSWEPGPKKDLVEIIRKELGVNREGLWGRLRVDSGPHELALWILENHERLAPLAEKWKEHEQ